MLPRIQPMRLTRVAKPFDDSDYLFELKHDGFRAIAYIEDGGCKLVSRNSNQFKSFGSLKESLAKLPVQNLILDGEVVCLDSNGVSQFNQLMSRKGTPVFYAFDLLWLNGTYRTSGHRLFRTDLRAGFGRHRRQTKSRGL